MKKGFTLIEIIAIIILLSVIALITYPVINNLITESKEKLYEKQISELERLSNTWVTKNTNKLKTEEGYTYDLSFEELNEQGFTSDKQIQNPKTGKNLTGCMKVTYNSSKNGYDVAYDEGCTPSGSSSEITFKNKILGASNSNIVTTGDGLYSKTTSTGTTYYYKGAVENNYVSFGGFTWRIVRINEDGTIRLITQDNVIERQAFNSTYNTYDKMYYTNSEIKTAVENWYKTNITDKGFDGKIVNGNYFCEQVKVLVLDDATRVDETRFSPENATIVTPDNYTPSFDCTTDGNGKGVVSGKVGLITIDEVLFAGGVIASSSNFYLKNGSSYWMMSPNGFFNVDYGAWAFTWFVNSSRGSAYYNTTDSLYGVRPVLNLSADTLVSGSGTSSDPYIVK